MLRRITRIKQIIKDHAREVPGLCLRGLKVSPVIPFWILVYLLVVSSIITTEREKKRRAGKDPRY